MNDIELDIGCKNTKKISNVHKLKPFLQRVSEIYSTFAINIDIES